mgnify:CR=1 FL=1
MEAKADLAALGGPTLHLLWANHYMKIVNNVPFSRIRYSVATPGWFEVGILRLKCRVFCSALSQILAIFRVFYL